MLQRFVRSTLAGALHGSGLLAAHRRWYFRDRAMVLMYHRVLNRADVPPETEPGIYVTTEAFEQHLRLLADSCEVVELDALVDHLRHRTLSRRPMCAITFDDGWLDNYKNAFPLLKRYQLPSTVFLVTGQLGRPDMLTWSQVREMEEGGVRFASHTVTHRELTILTPEALDWELAESRRELEQRVSRPSKCFCYPKGYFHKGALAAASRHYSAAVTTERRAVSYDENLFSIPRIGVHNDIAANESLFALRISGLYQRLPTMHPNDTRRTAPEGESRAVPPPEGPVRLLYVRDTLTICGPGKTIVNTWRAIDRERFHITVAATRPGPGSRNILLDELSRLGASTVELPIGRGVDLNTVRRLVQLIRRNRIDILQTHDAQTRRVGLLAAAITGVQHFNSVHGWIFNDGKQRAAKWLDARVIRTAQRVIAVSDKLRQDLESAGVRGDRISVLRNAILLDDYRLSGVPTVLKQELGIPAAHQVVSIIGRLSAEKGHEIFLKAAQIVCARCATVTFVIVGDGPIRARLEQLVQDLGLQERVRFAGHRADMADVYAMTDLLAISSYTEGIPNVLLEAFAYGKTAVATNVGGVPEVMSDRETGFLVAPGDFAALARHLLELLESDSLKARMGTAARDSIEARFSFNRRTRALEALYGSASHPLQALRGATQ